MGYQFSNSKILTPIQDHNTPWFFEDTTDSVAFDSLLALTTDQHGVSMSVVSQEL